jgi:hypothetical protein
MTRPANGVGGGADPSENRRGLRPHRGGGRPWQAWDASTARQTLPASSQRQWPFSYDTPGVTTDDMANGIAEQSGVQYSQR